MRSIKPWKFLKRSSFSDGVKIGPKMKLQQLQLMVLICIVMLFIVYRTTYYQYQHSKMEAELEAEAEFDPFDMGPKFRGSLNGLPRGIIESRSDLEMRPLWSTGHSRPPEVNVTRRHLLAVAVGIKLKENVDVIVRKFMTANFTVMLFHYDGNVDGWRDLEWSKKALHIVAENQTKWWFAKRFLHPDVVSLYDYIFLWDEDLGVDNFDPIGYLRIVRWEGFEISQPALDENSTNIHHKFTVRSRFKKYHRRVIDRRGSYKCSSASEGPPCTGFVEGMAPVFSRTAWKCAWHLIQNDLVHGWGMDMKLGYCAQGNRTQNVGIIDREYVVHQGIQTLGGPPTTKQEKPSRDTKKKRAAPDIRAEIRRQSTWELNTFKKRWNKAIEEDKTWVDPYKEENRRYGKRGGTQNKDSF